MSILKITYEYLDSFLLLKYFKILPIDFKISNFLIFDPRSVRNS